MRNSSVEKLLSTINGINGFLLVISTLFQVLALVAGVLLNEQNNFVEKFPWLVPVWTGALVLLIVTYILIVKLESKYPWPSIVFVGAVVGAFGALMVALALYNALPGHLNASGATQGLTVWKLLYRHISSVLVGVLTAIVAAVRWRQCRYARKKAAEEAAKSAGSTIGLDSFAGDNSEYETPKKLKRSLRAKAKAEAEKTDKTAD